MRRLIILGAVGAGAYAAYKAGYLPQLGPVVTAAETGLSHILPEELWGEAEAAKQARLQAIQDASGGQVIPILGQDEVVSVNAYEGMLRGNYSLVSAWARSNLGWAASIARVENAAMNPSISGDNGTSHGVYQVKVATAETCYRAGYSRMQPTKETLLTFEGGVYFGTSEMERLSKMGKPLEWIICAYNGGQGWEAMGAKYKRDRQAYLAKVRKAYVALYGSGVSA